MRMSPLLAPICIHRVGISRVGAPWGICISRMTQVPWNVPVWEFPKAGADLGAVTKGVGGVVGAFDISGILVPTVDSARCAFLLRLILAQRGRMANAVSPALVVGDPGTAKTASIRMYLAGAAGAGMVTKKVNFSSATTPALFQATMDGELDRRGGKSYGPPGNKHMTLFLDDMSMPARNAWGDQPTLELVRQLVGSDNMAFLDKDKRGEMKNVECMLCVGARYAYAHFHYALPHSTNAPRYVSRVYGFLVWATLFDICIPLHTAVTDCKRCGVPARAAVFEIC